MDISPKYSAFLEQYNKATAFLAYTKISSDLETPVSAMLKLKKDSKYHFLFESVQGGSTRARYSVIGLDPDLIWKVEDGKPMICRDLDRGVFLQDHQDIFQSISNLIDESAIDNSSLPPVAAGLYGYMAFDMVRYMEKISAPLQLDEIAIPDSIYIRPQIIVIFDLVLDEAMIVTPIRYNSDINADQAYQAAISRIKNAVEKLSQPLEKILAKDRKSVSEAKSAIGYQEYEQMVLKAKEYIAAGDIFQVVPSRRFVADFSSESFDLYRSLRHLNPSPYLFFVEFGDFALIGSSPEIMVKLEDKKVTIRPIAGTRKRGKTPAEDKDLALELLSDPKEIAEHLMLLDLGRNDVGRVAKPGTVKVTEQMTIEKYSHVMHIVSNVEGEIRGDLTAVDALIAGFPAGTVSGAPKIRAMEIIYELEPVKRSFYGGCVGYFASNGDMDSCIALRTALIKNGKLYAQAGGGVVADSNPLAEFEETANKAAAILKAASK